MKSFQPAGINKVILENNIKVYKNHYCKCGCGERILWNITQQWSKIPQYKNGHNLRLYKGINHPQYGVKQSKEWIEKRIKHMRGKNNPFFGKHPKSEFKKGKEHILYGKKPWNYGIPQSEEANKNHSIKMQGNTFALGHTVSKKTRKHLSKLNTGEKHPQWNGGPKAYKARRRNMGYIPMNSWFEGSEGHHIDDEFVIYIPEEMHKSNPHNQNNKETMKVINNLAFEFLAEQNLNNIF